MKCIRVCGTQPFDVPKETLFTAPIVRAGRRQSLIYWWQGTISSLVPLGADNGDRFGWKQYFQHHFGAKSISTSYFADILTASCIHTSIPLQ